jgi:hypothetical protein
MRELRIIVKGVTSGIASVLVDIEVWAKFIVVECIISQHLNPYLVIGCAGAVI